MIEEDSMNGVDLGVEGALRGFASGFRTHVEFVD